MKKSKGYIHKKGHNMSHPTEVYDHVVANQYKEKEFSRSAKIGMRARPNHLGEGLEANRDFI